MFHIIKQYNNICLYNYEYRIRPPLKRLTNYLLTTVQFMAVLWPTYKHNYTDGNGPRIAERIVIYLIPSAPIYRNLIISTYIPNDSFQLCNFE